MIFKNQLIKILITLFIWNSVSFLQTDNWKHFDKDNSGLPSNTIRCVTQDRKGIYWIGTWDKSVVKDNFVFNIHNDSKNNKWISTYLGGIFIYNEKDVRL